MVEWRNQSGVPAGLEQRLDLERRGVWKLDPNGSQVETLLQKGDEECPLSAAVPPRVVPCGSPDSQKPVGG